MGDIAEAKYDDDDEESKKKPVMQKLNATLGRNFANSQAYKDVMNELNESEQQKLLHRTLKGKSKLPEELKKVMQNSEEAASYQQWLSTRSTNLEKLHFIIGHGILRPVLRDEILCQICKQLSNNPSATSHTKGWILLSLCIGCFPATENFHKYLLAFIRDGPELYAPYCENRLTRTLKNGARTQPPSWLELQATKRKTPIELSIILMDGTSRKIEVDSASTADEISEELAKNIGLKDSFGFSIYITLYEKVMSLGSGGQHIMDAISNCEQYAKEQGGSERQAPWKLLYRKEIFTPWFNPVDDPVGTDLIYKQVTRGVNYGEYRCRSEKDVAMLAALQLYSEYGGNLDPTVLRKMLPEIIPRELLASGDTAVQKWEKLVQESFRRSRTITDRVPQQVAKEDIVIFAQINWGMMFSRFYEAVQIEGPKFPTNNVIIAVNSSGVFFVNEKEQILVSSHLTTSNS